MLIMIIVKCTHNCEKFVVGQIPGKPQGGRHGMVFGQITSSSTIGNSPQKLLVPGQRAPSHYFIFFFILHFLLVQLEWIKTFYNTTICGMYRHTKARKLESLRFAFSPSSFACYAKCVCRFYFI